MARGDLDQRLRAAFMLPGPPTNRDRQGRDAVSALPRYRARRRLAVAGIGASVAAVVGLSVGLVAGLQGSSTLQAAGPTVGHSAHGAPSQCVSVQLGSDRPVCAGRIESSAASTAEAPSAGAATSTGQTVPEYGTARVPPSSSGEGLRTTPGTRVVVSLPTRVGSSWTSVVLDPVPARGQAAPLPNGTRALRIHRDPRTGRTLALWPRTTPGAFELVASTLPSCAAATPGCQPRSLVWSITVEVR
jgi:hypothetical protein